MKRKILVSASLFHALNDAACVALPMVFPLLLSRRFIIRSYTQLGLLSYLGLFTTFLFQILVAQHAHKFEYRNAELFSILGVSLSLLLLTLSGGFASFLLFYLLMRTFASFYHPIGVATVSRAHPQEGMDFAMGIQAGSGNAGVFAAFILAGCLAQAFGWRTPLYVFSGTALVLGLAGYLAARKVSLKTEKPVSPDITSWIRALQDIKEFIPGILYGGACWGATVYYAPSLFHHKFGVPLGKTGVFLAGWIGVGTVMTYFFGPLSKAVGRRKAAQASLFGSTLFLVLLGGASRVGPAVAGLLLSGVFLFLIYPAFQSFVGSRVADRDQVLAFSLVANILMASGAVVVLVCGFLSDRFGISSPFLLLAVLGAAVCADSLRRGKFLPRAGDLSPPRD